ncbi:MAG: FliI/YscN family ATPase [Deltaproteobacteria bacterium]|nr:FliI/YscN family ATPase [Deltaproteobacteria bacterium]
MRIPPLKFWDQCSQALRSVETIENYGRVIEVIGLVIEGNGPACAIGDMCLLRINHSGKKEIPAEVVGFRDQKVLLMPLGDIRGVEPGSKIVSLGYPARARVGEKLLGRILNGLGNPIDEKGPIGVEQEVPLYAEPPNSILRKRISQPLDVGIKAVNALLSLGRGQRIALFSGSGVGKSTLLGMMARHTAAQICVVALIGERGREVREFIEKDLGEEGLKRSVVVVATSDQSPLVRIRGAYLATAIAEYFRDQGKEVLFLMDSVTRYAMASREVGLSIGEPPTSKGYTPSVFAQLPKLLERAGTTPHQGSITGIYTVLVEGDDMNEPIADAIRSIADGHIVLSRDLANQGHYPAIDVLGSVSRVMVDVVGREQLDLRNKLIQVMATHRRMEDLINIGAYVEGTNPEIDLAIKKMPEINGFLRQAVSEKVNFAESLVRLKSLFP